ncbi:MAG: hypothetical protein ACTSRP_19520 [Candidatus Helarchaeota archaeon]
MEYKINFDKYPLVKNSGDPNIFYKWKLNSLILKMVYPQILSKLVIKYDNDIDKAKEAVKAIGYRAARRIIKEYPIKEYNPKILIRKLTYRHWGTKSVVKGKTKDGELRIIVKKCPLCEGLIPLDIEGLHYCISFSGFLEGAFKTIQELYDKFPRNNFVFDTIESKGSNNPICIHLCRIEG